MVRAAAASAAGRAASQAGARKGSAARSGSRAADRTGSGTTPGIACRPVALVVERGDAAEQALGVGVLRLLEDRHGPPACSTTRPAYITSTRSTNSATTPRSWVIRITAMPNSLLQRAQQVEDLRLDGDVERGRRLVGDQQVRGAGQRHGDHHPLAHAARELVRIVARAAGRARGCRPGRAARARVGVRGLLADPLVLADRLGDLVADREHRVERGHRLLEDHRDRGRRGSRASAARTARAGRGPRTRSRRRRCGRADSGSAA